MAGPLDTTVLSEHDAVLLDLDGTVYRGGELIAGVDTAVQVVRDRDVAVRYVTNNASKSKRDFASRLVELGLNTGPDEVNTSPEAAAAMLAERLPRGTEVFVLGSVALAAEVDNVGLLPVRSRAAGPAAVVQGLSTDIAWADLAEATLVLRDGALWVATNKDATLPTERGELPGNGSLVAALVAASGGEPLVAGKPERPLLDRAVSSAGARAPLFIGDRLDTDIAGATRAGMTGMLVLTGVSCPRDVLEAPVEQRPLYIARDVRALHEPREAVRVDAQQGWEARVRGDVLELARSRSGSAGETLAALRALCSVWWHVGGGPVEVHGDDEPSRAALAELDLVDRESRARSVAS